WTKLGDAAQRLALRTHDLEKRQRLFGVARNALERAAGLVPCNAFNQHNLGQCLVRMARAGWATPAEVFSPLDKALALDPTNRPMLLEAGSAALALGDLDHARRYARQGLAYYPDHALFLSQLGYVALRQRCDDEALAILSKAVNADWSGREKEF